MLKCVGDLAGEMRRVGAYGHLNATPCDIQPGVSHLLDTVEVGEVAASLPTGDPGTAANQMSATTTTTDRTRLTAADLVPDEPLRGDKKPIADSEDLLQHRVIARKVAELATSANGKVNIALFGPWGAGKSSFNGLLAEELAAIDPTARHITFDAWKNAGEGFRTNFLSELARQIPRADQNISDQLFQTTSRVTFPFAGKFAGERGTTKLAWTIIGFLLALFIIVPLLWTIFQNALDPVDDFLVAWWANITGWAGIAVSSTLLVVVGAGLIELSKVTVSKSTPSHVAQFSDLFNKLLSADKKRRFVVFIDELDRCGESDVMTTLEGLRTFLGHERCVFVVAFDREAIAKTIAKQMHHNVPVQASSPYYRTSGEYLDKIFQFQLSLPPQPAHTFRRYALSLVIERDGVWAAVRKHREGLLDRVIMVLSPMHLASPRRTKVLLNDFAVNMRVYESLGFEWLVRAEEIAVLTVLQTEFPNLMADVERTPSLMRFLYREETPKRPELVELLNRYQPPAEPGESGGEDAADVHLDQIVGDGGEKKVAHDLQANLARYLRRLREMDVPEPRADLIMMHSDKALLHFEDPSVYHDVLLAADRPRQDVLKALATAAPNDRSLAIDHVLEQAERESTEIALSLRVIAGELAADLPHVSVKQADHLRSGVSRGLSGHTRKSLEGYARAVAASYTKAAVMKILTAAAEQSSEALGAVVGRLTDELPEAGWAAARQIIATRVLPKASELPDATARLLRRMAEDSDFELDAKQIGQFAASLSVTKPEEVEPASATTAARQQAQEQNAEALETFEQDRDAVHDSATTIVEVWSHLPSEALIRRSLLQVLRAAEDDSFWFLDLHDELIAQDISDERFAAANSYLLQAIVAMPGETAKRWRDLLSDSAPVDHVQKAAAMAAVVKRATTVSSITSRTNAANNAYRIARLPSEPVSAVSMLSVVADDIDREWDEYTDSRFEYQLRLLGAIDRLEDPQADTATHRVNLFLAALVSAQQEDASVDQIVASVTSAPPAEAAAIATAVHGAQMWEQEHPHRPLVVLLTAQERALDAGERVEPIPAAAIAQLSDVAERKPIADAWLATAPPLAEVQELLGSNNFGLPSWSKYGDRVSGDQRAATWHALHKNNSSATVIRALSAAGQNLDVYETAAATVRDAKSKDTRQLAVDKFLALPVTSNAAGLAQALVKSLAAGQKVTEVPLGIRLIQAYYQHWPQATVAALRPSLTQWVDAGESYVVKRDQAWLIDHGFVVRKSSLFERWLSGARK